MTALHRVKAYFGMVPADELDAYDGYDDPRDDADRRYDERRPADRYADRHEGRHDDRFDERYEERRRPESDRWHASRAEERWSDRYESRHGDERLDDRHDERHEPERRSPAARDTGEDVARAPRPRDPRETSASRSTTGGPDVPESREESEVESRSRGRSWATNTGPNHTSVRPTAVGASRATPSLTPLGSSPSGGPGSLGGASTRGALAVDDEAARRREATPSTPPAPVAEAEPASAPAEITSLQPTSYNEARVIGERYRDGIPVIMNLTDMDEVAAKRLVDFAAGLAFALRGSIEKVTNRVFLLSPPNVEVSAAECRKIAEGSCSVSS